MTQKELLYVKDAYEHENVIISVLEEFIENIDDEDIISFIDKQIKKHQSTIDELIKLLEVNSK